MAYSEKVMDHFNNPRNVGEMENPSGVGTVGNAKCGDIMRMYLDIDDNGIIQESSGSACTSGSLDPSHVLLAIGLPHEIAHGSLRLTLSEKTTMEDIDYTVDKLKAIIERLRGMSPLYEDFVKKNADK